MIRVRAKDVAHAAMAPARDLDKPVAPGSNTVMGLGVLGAGIGAAVIYADANTWHGTACFTETPQFAFWVILAIAQAALWSIAAVPVYRSLRRLWQWWPENRVEIITSAVLFSALVWGFLLAAALKPNLDYPLPNHHAKILILSGLAYLVALGGGIGIWLVHAALLLSFTSTAPGGEQIRALLSLKADLRRLLAIEGAIIGSAILASGALRQAVLHATCAPKTVAEHVLLRVLLCAPSRRLRPGATPPPRRRTPTTGCARASSGSTRRRPLDLVVATTGARGATTTRSRREPIGTGKRRHPHATRRCHRRTSTRWRLVREVATPSQKEEHMREPTLIAASSTGGENSPSKPPAQALRSARRRSPAALLKLHEPIQPQHV